MNIAKWIDSLKDKTTEEVYELALKYQMIMSEKDNMESLKQIKKWEDSQRILEIGCGPGYFIQSLLKFFPDKSYLGLDVSEKFISIASDLSLNGDVEFICEDIYKFESKEKFDFIHVRAVLQHLPSIPDFLVQLERLLKDDGQVLIFDAPYSKDLQIKFKPAIPSFDDFMQEITISQKSNGGNRDCLEELAGILSNSKFQLLDSDELFIAGEKEYLKNERLMYIYFVVEVLSRLYKPDFDNSSFKSELKAWYASLESFSQFHGKWMLLGFRN